MEQAHGGIIAWVSARVIAAPALAMPYGLRMRYIRAIAFLVHVPFRAFGRIARYLLQKLDIALTPPVAVASEARQGAPASAHKREGAVAVLFSGGTDSTCAAALVAKEHSEVHLLTMYEDATRRSPAPDGNAAKLAAHFTGVRFERALLSVDKLVRHLSYERYGAHLRRHGWLVLATCGFSSLSWHVRAIHYCRERGITRVVDGLTRELMHFPGHMDASVALFRDLYARYGITYENPVREWPVPPDQQLIDKVVVNPHADFIPGGPVVERTTGRYLYDIGLFPHPNIKGSRMDFEMQHDCYPFALYNILTFWGFLTAEPYEKFAARIHGIMREKADAASRLLDDHIAGGASLAKLLD